MGSSRKGQEGVFIYRSRMPWLRRIWTRCAKTRGSELADMVISIVNSVLRQEDEELDRKLRAMEELEKP